MLKVKDIMTRDVVALSPESTIREAMEVLTANHLSGAPVTAGETVVGVVSMTDIVTFMIGTTEHPVEEEDEPIVETWENIEELDEEAEEIRLLSLSEEVWDEWSKPEEKPGEAFPERTSILDKQIVEEIMNPEVFSIAPDATVKAAATIMRKHGIHRVLVMKGKTLAGIISAMDIARAVSKGGATSNK
jgi:CBS domain-containing protein